MQWVGRKDVIRPLPPCGGCEERSEKCHQNCKRYKIFKIKTELVRRDEHRMVVDSYQTDGYIKRHREALKRNGRLPSKFNE